MPQPIGFDPSLVNQSTTGYFVAGETREYAGAIYRFVQNANGASDNALADGDLVYWASATAYTVCNALNGVGSALSGNPAAGIAVGAVTKGNYGFIMIFGRHTNVKSTSTTAGVPQKVSATAATVTDQTAATIAQVGTALTATSGGRCTLAVRCL